MEDARITAAEKNLIFLHSVIPAAEKFYLWCFGRDGRCLGSSCPAEIRPLLETLFRSLGGLDQAVAYAALDKRIPLLISSSLGMQWAVTCETERGSDLLFVMGPVFYSSPRKEQIQTAMRSPDHGVRQLRLEKMLLSHLSSLPVLPYAVFIRYVIMVHNMLTKEQLDISVFRPKGSICQEPSPSHNHDRSKIYLAEQALLRMVREGDINYEGFLIQSLTMSSGVPLPDAIQQARANIIIFTTLVSRAAMEGGLHPDIAYPLGDSYIAAALRSRDFGELSALAATMYHDFIWRVHQNKTNPHYSTTIQKCCDYIALSLGKAIRISDLAALTGYSNYYLTEKFKKETGLPLFLYIRRARIARAKLLLETSDLSVKSISEQLAFRTPNYFIKCFRKEAGTTPAQYRKLYSAGSSIHDNQMFAEQISDYSWH